MRRLPTFNPENPMPNPLESLPDPGWKSGVGSEPEPPPDDGEECPLCGKPLGDEEGTHLACAEDEAARADR